MDGPAGPREQWDRQTRNQANMVAEPCRAWPRDPRIAVSRVGTLENMTERLRGEERLERKTVEEDAVEIENHLDRMCLERLEREEVAA